MTRNTDKTTVLLDDLLADCTTPEEILGVNWHDAEVLEWSDK
jgi:hypothetical protein